MFIIPVGNRVNWKHPPLLTLLLVALNCFVFFFVQSGDAEREAEAHRYYFASDLPHWELTRYARTLEQDGRVAAAHTLRALQADKDDAALDLMEGDSKFMHGLRHQQVITPAMPEYAAWRAQRVVYESKRSFTNRHVYDVDDPDPVNGLVSAFMHGGFDHLFGNMMVLVIVGFLVESVIGRALFALLYVVSIYAALLVFSLTASGQSVLGASGAIAGVMGAYTVIFGRRKIDFFYSLAFYFDYVRAPAIVLLPLWLGNELYQFVTEHGAHVAYMAHFGGLLGGAAMGGLYRWQRGGQIEGHHRAQESREADDQAFQRGLAHLAAFEFGKALAVFKLLQHSHPDDTQLQRLIFRAAKPDPAGDDYHRAAVALLSLPEAGPAAGSEKLEVFSDYWQRAQPAPRLGRKLMAALACEFAGAGRFEEAEKLAAALRRVAPAHEAVPKVLLALARGYYREHRRDRFDQLLVTLVREYPGSREASAAAQMLRMV